MVSSLPYLANRRDLMVFRPTSFRPYAFIIGPCNICLGFRGPVIIFCNMQGALTPGSSPCNRHAEIPPLVPCPKLNIVFIFIVNSILIRYGNSRISDKEKSQLKKKQNWNSKLIHHYHHHHHHHHPHHHHHHHHQHHWKNSPSSENSARFVFSQTIRFHLLEFATILFYRARSSALLPTPNLEDHGPVFMSPPIQWPNFTPRHRVPFPSPSTTRRTIIEEF
jgi:hypothetical protein